MTSTPDATPSDHALEVVDGLIAKYTQARDRALRAKDRADARGRNLVDTMKRAGIAERPVGDKGVLKLINNELYFVPKTTKY